VSGQKLPKSWLKAIWTWHDFTLLLRRSALSQKVFVDLLEQS